MFGVSGLRLCQHGFRLGPMARLEGVWGSGAEEFEGYLTLKR